MLGSATTVITLEVPSAKRWQHVQRTCRRVPWYTLSMMIVYISVYYNVPVRSTEYMELVFDTHKPREMYRWWTYSLLHMHATHLWINVTMMFLFGGVFEYDQWWWRAVIVHNASIYGGALACGWDHRFADRKRVLLVGASGGIYGLLSALTGNLILNWPELSFEKRLLNTSVLCSGVISDIVSNAVRPNPSTSYSTHVGGFVTGVLMSSCVVHNIKKYDWETKWRWTTAGLLSIFFLAGFLNLIV